MVAFASSRAPMPVADHRDVSSFGRFRRALVGVAALVALLLPMERAHAQAACNGGASCALVVTLRLGRPEVYRLALSQTTTTVPAPTAADFTAGFRDAPGPIVTIAANSPYRVTVQAAFTAWQYTGSAANPGKPANDLRWSRAATGPWTLAGTASTLWPATGTAAPATASQTVSLFYRTLWQWTGNPPGTYALPVNITLTSP